GYGERPRLSWGRHHIRASHQSCSRRIRPPARGLGKGRRQRNLARTRSYPPDGSGRKRQPGDYSRLTTAALHVELEEQNVPVLHNVVLAFRPQQPLLLHRLLAAVLEQVLTVVA